MLDRLTKADWIRHGLRTLATDGPNALKVGPMAARLKVSRGSFYWHFEDIAEFRSLLLRTWPKVVASVDVKRVDRIAGLLIEAGLDRERAEHRAAFLYWAYLGQAVVMDSRQASIPDWALDEISDLFEA